jgi:2-succinyl-5-enolpyruvyl-6-hydroxy-3-cyclohexene-1-carboxylate synthase
VHRLGAHLGLPVLAEAASNARYGFPEAIGAYDAFSRTERFATTMKPDLVLRFGGGLTAKSMIQLSAPTVVEVCDDHHVFDPAHAAQHVVHGDAVRACELLRKAVKVGGSSTWRSKWLAAERAVRARLAKATGWSEPLVARAVVAALPAGSNLVLSSSMPIRDVDAFALDAATPLHVYSNRGVNGIDGVMSTALGVVAATGRQTTLLIGDVALLHDLGAWVAARTLALPLTVVAVNNDGGGIFHFLPVAERTPHFERLFGTPHGVDLAHVAGLAGAVHARVESVAGLQQAVRASKGLALIEAVTNRTDNVAQHRALFAQLAAAADETLGGRPPEKVRRPSRPLS